jgi:methylglutaconyl-CoA hydratase
MSELIRIEDRAALRILTLNRPDKRNALSTELMTLLHAELGRAIDDEGIRSIAITGAGPAFSAGLDLREVQASQSDPKMAQRGSDVLYDLLDRVYRSPKPVIAAINGSAVAGGAGLMSVCDLVIAAESARIGYPEVKRGLVAAIVMTFLVRQVGERRAKFLLLTGELFDAAAAQQMGLINEVVPDRELMSRVEYWGEQFAASPPEALALTKSILYEIQALSPDESIRHVRKVHTQMRSADSADEAIQNFLGGKS